MSEKIKPYGKESKKKEVAEMFDNISKRYDFLNHFLSLGIDKLWRRKAIKLLKKKRPKKILDIATGTGDFAIDAQKLAPEKIIGVDISDGMLEIGRKKIAKKNLDNLITLENGDAELLPYENNSFDAITVGFGVRNFEHLENGLKEMLRVLNEGGQVAVLEFSKPKKFPIKQAFSLYSKVIIPTVGKTVSKDRRAYQYLPESVAAFPEGEDFLNILNKIGYINVTSTLLSGGIATIYTAEKKSE